MGALYSPVEGSELNRKTVGNYWPPFVSTEWADLFCGEAFSACGKRVKGNETGVDRQSLAIWQEA
jgi:hypothetical protein